MNRTKPNLERNIVSRALGICLLVAISLVDLNAQLSTTTEVGCGGDSVGARPTLRPRVDVSDLVLSLGGVPDVDERYRDFRGLVIEEVLIVESYPVLPLIFFEQGRSELPARYEVLADSAATAGFRDDILPGGTLDKYRHLLNIIGYRMRQHPRTRISIRGHDSKQTSLGESGRIAEERAINVARYLQTIWKIDPSRTRILPSGGLPRVRSNIRDSVTNAENRRVEITSDDWEIIRPIVQRDFRRSIDPGTIRFEMSNGIPADLISRRRIEITRNGLPWHTLHRVGVTDSITGEYAWGKNDAMDSIPTDDAPYVAELVLRLKDRSECRSLPLEIPVWILRQRFRPYHEPKGSSRTTYMLNLFPAGSSSLDPAGLRIVREIIADSLRAGARVRVRGHAFMEPGVEKLSVDRAHVVAEAIRKFARPGTLGSLEEVGIADQAQLYSDRLPEGRFFNRTVQVQIIMPDDRSDPWSIRK